MLVKKAYSFSSGSAYCHGVIEEPSACPICKNKIKPVELSSKEFQNDDGEWRLSLLYLCKGCYQTFLTLHSIKITERSSTKTPVKYVSSLQYCEPNRHERRAFPEDIAILKSSFSDIYDEAARAESEGLAEICGMGYRKALEYLVRDYLKHLYPADEPTMKEMELGNLIANKVPIEKIRISASRCAWLGNDHAHYYKKFEDKDLSDLKRLFDSVVYWVAMELATQEASELEKR